MIQSGVSPDIASKYVEMYRAFNDRLVKSVPRKPENNTPTSIEEFAKTFAAAYQAHSKQ
jgi:hypothetical protein